MKISSNDIFVLGVDICIKGNRFYTGHKFNTKIIYHRMDSENNNLGHIARNHRCENHNLFRKPQLKSLQ